MLVGDENGYVIHQDRFISRRIVLSEDGAAERGTEQARTALREDPI